jgi:hypothetical protein
MTVVHHVGPLVVSGADAPGDSNPSAGPSLFRHGVGLLDPRFNAGFGSGENAATYAWYGTTRIPILDAIPTAMFANNIAASQVPVAGTPLTLVTVSGNGIIAGASVRNAVTGVLATPVLAMENLATPINASASFPTISLYDPRDAVSRNVRITSAGADAGGTFTVKGFDFYGFPVTEIITGAGVGVASGKKAFKYIQSITPSAGLSGANVQAGNGDVFGLMLRAETMPYVELYAAGLLVTAATGFTGAVTTDPSTPLLGDVRGTYAVQTPSDGIRRLQFFWTPDPAALFTNGLFGVPQV